jgi:hypothetical protein
MWSEVAALRIFLVLAVGALAVLMFTGRLGFDTGGASVPKPQVAVDGVNDILEKAVEAGEPAKAGTPAAKLNNQCGYRERRLAALSRPRSLAEVRPHALRVLAVLQAHSRRAVEPPEVQALDLEQQRIIQRLARAAGLGNYRAAQEQAMALRELAGRANVTLMRLRLTHCLMRASAIPL